MNTCTAIVPYTCPPTFEEFIRREVKKGITQGTIYSRIISLIPKSSTSSLKELIRRSAEKKRARGSFSRIGLLIPKPSTNTSSIDTEKPDYLTKVSKLVSGTCPIINPHRERTLKFASDTYQTERILHSSEYGDLMKDPELLFHGIGNAIWKVPSILRFGILSKKAASAKNLTLGFNYGWQSKNGVFNNGENGDLHISCARSPVHIYGTGTSNGAFGLFIKNGISFAIRDVSATEKHNSTLPGEAMVKLTIPSESIIGLVVPESLLRSKITDISFLQDKAIGTFHLRCQSLLRYLEEEVNIEYQNLGIDLSSTIETKDEREKLKVLLNGLLLKYFSSKVDIETACLIDLLKIIIPSGLKIYNTKGFEVPLDEES